MNYICRNRILVSTPLTVFFLSFFDQVLYHVIVDVPCVTIFLMKNKREKFSKTCYVREVFIFVLYFDLYDKVSTIPIKDVNK